MRLRMLSAAQPWTSGPVMTDSSTSGSWSRTFPGTPEQVRGVRAFLAGLLDDDPAASDAVLCLSELSANAVQHSRSGEPGGTFTVRVAFAARGAFLVAVADRGGAWLPRSGPDLAGGRGLLIVRELAADWGVAGDETGWTVWFCMGGSGAAGLPASVAASPEAP